MITTAAKVDSIQTIAKVETKFDARDFVGVALFSGIGLLLSLAVLILDQISPGEWF